MKTSRRSFLRATPSAEKRPTIDLDWYEGVKNLPPLPKGSEGTPRKGWEKFYRI